MAGEKIFCLWRGNGLSELTILTLIIIGAANMAVGGCIGICGIAGFLLPMLYTGGLGFDVTYALALSFLAFLVSGVIGSRNYYKAGNLDIKMSVKSMIILQWRAAEEYSVRYALMRQRYSLRTSYMNWICRLS